MITVVAALIESGGKLLVCQRRRNDSFGLMWEFPGGKTKPGESLAQALERELEEELGAKARVGREIYRTRHQYAEMSEPIELFFFSATLPDGEVQSLAFEQIAWREPATLYELNFLPADRDLIEKLSTGALRLP
ncbi:MAG TPA: NUDIX domain-containing protein [Candidatus Limnocylindria bacterium]|nr:NUDIX domain-containing protein [Candidatus Limnocylindria bacterium]